MKCFGILWTMKNGVKYEYMSHGKMSDFVSSPLFGLTLVKKLRAFNFESNWNTSMFFNKKDMTSDLNMSRGKMYI